MPEFDQPYFFLLESTMGGAGGWAVMASNPQEVVTARETPDILAVIQKSLQKKRRGIWIGYLGYEYYTQLTGKVPERRSDLIPEGVFCYYENHIEIADFAKFWRVLPQVPPTGAHFIPRRRAPDLSHPLTMMQNRQSLQSNFTRPAYLSAIRKIKSYLTAGDCYQVNLSQRFSCETDQSPCEIYQRLRQVSPAPYSAFLNLGDAQILSASPESFLQVDGRRVITRPIKGTRPRGTTPVEDARLKEELITSRKDRAELLMITDLLRNDLGRVCEKGSIEVPKLCEVESFAQVHHLVSTVEGRLAEGRDVVDLLRATFPGGSITGAPKIRAMEIIHELERVPRNVYTGTIGVIYPDGSATFNIAIRTLILKEKTAYFWGGGGIIADSDPQAEYEETLTKVKGIIHSLS